VTLPAERRDQLVPIARITAQVVSDRGLIEVFPDEALFGGKIRRCRGLEVYPAGIIRVGETVP
jgi:hypothetical protein